jgi:hypothetical protein
VFQSLAGVKGATYPVTLHLADLLARFPGRFITEIDAELERLEGPQYPADLLWHVFEAANFRDAWHATQAADRAGAGASKGLPDTPIYSLVRQLEFEAAQARFRGE